MINRDLTSFDQADAPLASQMTNTYYQTPSKPKQSLSKIIIVGTLTILIFVLPWIFCIATEEYYEITKNVLLLVGIAILVMVWGVTTIIKKRVTLFKTPIDWAVLAMIVVATLSTIFSVNADTSIWGYHMRMTGGLISYILIIAIYYLIINNINNKFTIKFLLRCIVYSISLLALFTVLKSLGLLDFIFKPIATAHPTAAFLMSPLFSPIGNPNSLAYLFLVGLPLSVFLLINNKGKKFIDSLIGIVSAVSIILAISFTSLTTTNDISRVIVWILVLAVIICGIVFAAKNTKTNSKIGLNIALLFVFIIGVLFSFDINFRTGLNNTLTKAGLEFNFSRYYDIPASTGYQVVTGTYNKYALKSIAIGTGLDTYAYMFPQFRPVEQNLQMNWFENYTRSNSQIESMLVGMGVLGTVALFGSLAFFIIKFVIKVLKHKEASKRRSLIAVILVMVIYVFSFFLVYHSITLLFFFWTILALGFKLFMINYPETSDLLEAQFKLINRADPAKSISLAPYLFTTTIVIGALVLIVSVTTNYCAERYYSAGLKLASQNEYDKAYDNYYAAASLNPAHDYYHRDIASVALAKLDAILTASTDTSKLTAEEKSNQETVANYLLNLITAKVDQAIILNPENHENWQRAAVIYKRLTELSQGKQFGSQTLQAIAQAITRNPTNPDNYLILGYIYQFNSDETLRADAEKAYLKAYDLQPSYALSIIQLGGYLEDKEKYEDALALYSVSKEKIFTTESTINTFLSGRIDEMKKKIATKGTTTVTTTVIPSVTLTPTTTPTKTP